jgi:AbrB family looped-hinge helix DNA binding protein
MGITELRKVQALQGEKSLTIVLPKEFATLLGIRKGDYLKVRLHDDKLIFEKAEI